jgi:hypothetical protein
VVRVIGDVRQAHLARRKRGAPPLISGLKMLAAPPNGRARAAPEPPPVADVDLIAAALIAMHDAVLPMVLVNSGATACPPGRMGPGERTWLQTSQTETRQDERQHAKRRHCSERTHYLTHYASDRGGTGRTRQHQEALESDAKTRSGNPRTGSKDDVSRHNLSIGAFYKHAKFHSLLDRPRRLKADGTWTIEPPRGRLDSAHIVLRKAPQTCHNAKTFKDVPIADNILDRFNPDFGGFRRIGSSR